MAGPSRSGETKFTVQLVFNIVLDDIALSELHYVIPTLRLNARRSGRLFDVLRACSIFRRSGSVSHIQGRV